MGDRYAARSEAPVSELKRMLLERADTLSRDGPLALHKTYTDAVYSGNVLLCGNDPVLLPLIVYWLSRAQFRIVGVVDDESAGERLLRHTVLSSFELSTQAFPPGTILLNCATHNARSYRTFQKVAAHLNAPVLNAQQFAYIARHIGKDIRLTFSPDFYVQSIVERGDRYLSVLPLLDDEASTQVLLRVLLGRLHIDFDWFWSAYSPVADMYFPNFFIYGDEEIFVDAGAFDGNDTVRFLRKRHYRFKECHLFEISPSNIQKIHKTLDELDGTGLRDRIHVVPSGLSNEKGQVAFCGEDLYAVLASVQAGSNNRALTTKPCDVVDLNSAIDRAESGEIGD